MTPEPIKAFIARFARLPAIGPRLATRLAFYVATQGEQTIVELAAALQGLATLDLCPQCFTLKPRSETTCAVCSDPTRTPRVVAIVERDTDRMALERTGRYHGRYLVMGELPERGVLEPEHRRRLTYLADRIRRDAGGKIDEVIIAVGLHSFGDLLAGLIREEFQGLAKKITRLGRGIPTGGEIEFADEETLCAALERRG
ncbi:MAG: toprim domain-containing protein [bacterium]|nr:toprim domain-containing protein [bacterium]